MVIKLKGLTDVVGTPSSTLSTNCLPCGTIADARKKKASIQTREAASF
jgi:hypothetical protein